MLHCCSYVFAKRPVSQGYDGGRKDANVKKQQHRMACVHCTSVYVCACVCICVYTCMYKYSCMYASIAILQSNEYMTFTSC